MKHDEALALIELSLASLKDFQKATVASVLHSFDTGTSQRILVADEVGLGKTVVAKGIIAELLKERLQAAGNRALRKPLRVTYICSNQTLARENRIKLAVFKGEAQKRYVQEPSFGRLITTAMIDNNYKPDKGMLLEVCTLTPSTSFNLTRGDGSWRERMIILCALLAHKDLRLLATPLRKFWRGRISDAKWWREQHSEHDQNKTLKPLILKEFHRLLGRTLSQSESQRCGFDVTFDGTWIELLVAIINKTVLPKKLNRVRSSLRVLLAQACSKNISADLFILDEFQRFKGLLDTNCESEESIIARQVFGHKGQSNGKVLLLSATPFKAYSQAHDDEEGDSHDQELQFLLRFISGSDEVMLANYQEHRCAHQQQILSLKNTSLDILTLNKKHKNAIEHSLQPLICRTERGQISESYEAVFKTVKGVCDEHFSQADIKAFKALDDVGEALNTVQKGRLRSQLMEFYKASPWALSFMSGYQFKKQLDTHADVPEVKKALKRSTAAWLSRKAVDSYTLKLADAPHAKIRALSHKLFAGASETLLWVPPSLPHYPLNGCFEGQESFSKTLLFSSWAMVPRALSGLISYEAERRLIAPKAKIKENYFKKHSPKIKFDRSASLQGWSLIYPAQTLQRISLGYSTNLSLGELLAQRSAGFQDELECLNCYTDQKKGERSGDRWYALAPLLLDRASGFNRDVETWLSIAEGHLGQGESNAQLKEIRSYLALGNDLRLGPMPDDLPRYLAYLSIASPAVCAARSWRRIWGEADELDIVRAATTIGFAGVSLFNKAESDRIIHRVFKVKKYFLAVVRYCAEGDFQAVVDEFGHLLEEQGLEAATKKLAATMSFSPTRISCQFEQDKLKASVKTTENNKQQERHSLRCHYAVPLGNQKLTDEKGVNRIGEVRDAFNSPFRPFMLNSTSIGQEGLDFHWYCRQIVHWNLPANPIDIEQREGRINRYKSLLVRKRVAQVYGEEFNDVNGDPWLELFSTADIKTKAERRSDLVPYWHYPVGDTNIERYVPMKPMSKEVSKLELALKVLVLYRLAFGQPRQEELLKNVLRREFDDKELALINDALVINLAPLIHNNFKAEELK
tara:strand:- start:3393 stop:6656 length:3264 start_codon:yes stop_codon:yes gene_type:complete